MRSISNVGSGVLKKNMGTADRFLRILAAVAIVVLYLTGSIGGITAVVLGVIAAVFVITSVVGFCPGYVPFGISTRKGPSSAVRV
jgi:hypothetical protein